MPTDSGSPNQQELEAEEARQRTAKSELEAEEARQRMAKTELESQKLLLEQRLLTRQLSIPGVAMEWLKAAAVPAALLGAALTFYVGFGQIGQSEQNRLADRFDKALARLASDKSNERVTGVSGLRLFVRESDSALQVPALHFLVNAVSVESDPLVQSAILDVFADLKVVKIAESGLNEALRTAIKRNRNLAQSIRAQWHQRIWEDRKTRITQFTSLNLAPDKVPNPIPQALIAKLSQSEYLQFLDDERGPFEQLEPKLDLPLRGLARLISTLITLGGTEKDFSGIYCVQCDFAAAKDLNEATFENAYLSGANFSHVSLKKASFRNADLSGTIFFSADLSEGDLRNNTNRPENFRDTSTSFPLLECANLKGTDLSGTPLLTYHRDFSTNWTGERAFKITAPRMLSAQIDKSTKLEEFGVVNYTYISDAYLLKHPKDIVVSPFRDRRDDLTQDPMLDGLLVSAAFRRFNGDFTVTEYTSTLYIQYSLINAKRLVRLRSEIKPVLTGYLSQPPLLAIPLLLQFNETLGEKVSTPQTKTPQEKTQTRWKENLDYTCKDVGHPNVRKLMIDHRLETRGW